MKRYTLDVAEQQVISAQCAAVNRSAPSGRGLFFVGNTADANGYGEALVEVLPSGDIVRHWGTSADHLKHLAKCVA